MSPRRELLLCDGRIYVFDDDRTVAESLLVRDGRVAAVGSTETVEAAATDPTVLDLDGRTVLPGFNDAHTHLFSVGVQLLETDLAGAGTRAEALDRLAANAETTPAGEWVLGFGYDESTWPAGERDYLARAELDAVSEDHPVAAFRVDGHTASLNGVALDAVSFDGVEGDVVGADGDPTGRVVEDATGRVRVAAAPDVEKAREALAAAVARHHELGITSCQTVAGLTRTRDQGSVELEALHAAHREGDLDLRVTYYVHATQADSLADMQVASGFGDDVLRVGGLKTFSDGALGAQTAKLHGEYADDPGNGGQMVHDGDRLEAWFETAARADQQIATHAIGGQAIDVVVARYEAVLDEYDAGVDPRPRIEHLELASDEALARMAEAGMVASMQPNFLQWSMPDGLYESRLGPGALPENNRFRDVLDAGIPLAFGSDTMPVGPLYGIHLAVNIPHDRQRLTVDEAVAAYTRGAAYAEYTEDVKGTLEVGRYGDAVVLDRDPHDHPEEIGDLVVEATVLDGRVVYER